ncbi:MAG TPA: peptidoglycan-binding protein [Pseudonocardia sp.]
MDWSADYGVESGDVISILAVDHVFYDAEMRTGGSLAWDSYNPGNIQAGSFAVTQGAYPGKVNYRFAVFPDEATGSAAIVALLRTPTYSGLTILQTMNLYAPAGDPPNDPATYAAKIAATLGVSTGTVLNTLSDDQLLTVAAKIQDIEGWIPGQSYDQDNLPSDVTDWLDTYPDSTDRANADQPFASLKSSGPGVTNLQQLLSDRGYLAAADVIGTFGPKTKAAVTQFQADNGLTADGVCGHATWVALTS